MSAATKIKDIYTFIFASKENRRQECKKKKNLNNIQFFFKCQFVIKVSFSQASRGIAEKGQKRAQ